MREVNFSVALGKILTGKRAKRSGWPVWIYLAVDHLVVFNEDALTTTNWRPTQKDLLALDWVVEGE